MILEKTSYMLLKYKYNIKTKTLIFLDIIAWILVHLRHAQGKQQKAPKKLLYI